MEASHESKVSARIDNDIYLQVQNHFHHGQQTMFLRKIYNSLKILIDKEGFGSVTDYLYKKSDLTLPGN